MSVYFRFFILCLSGKRQGCLVSRSMAWDKCEEEQSIYSIVREESVVVGQEISESFIVKNITLRDNVLFLNEYCMYFLQIFYPC